MLYALTKNIITPDDTTQIQPECILHFFTREEAYYQEDEFNAWDNDPGIFYETLECDIVDTCDFCGANVQDIIWH